MPNENSSFIPKSGVKTVKRSQASKQIYLLAYISYIFFFSTLFAVIGVYVYGATVDRSLERLKQQMAAERQRFAVAEIDNIKQLDKRLKVAERLVSESTAPSRLFPDIESVVSSKIKFSGLSYEQLPNRKFVLELNGRADQFNDIISQKQLLQGSGILSNAEVIEFDYSVSGEKGSSVSGNTVLTFVFADTRDLSAIAYVPAPVIVEEITASTSNLVIEESVTGVDTETGDESTTTQVQSQ